jgi:Na+/H+-dicarboxylate symporter
MDVLDGIYRTLELIIAQVNLFIPVLVFAMSAYFAASATPATLHAMGGFIAVFSGVAVALSAVAVVFVWKKSNLAFPLVLQALKTPMLISLTSSSATATIPDTIHAMSSKLGFSRGIVEFVVPASSVLMRSGAALYFAMLAVFISNLYGQPVNSASFGLICLGATLAAFASAGHSGLAVVGFVGVVLQIVQLPVEAALALFMAIDHICEGPRSLLSLMMACVLIVIVSEGLPSERLEAQLKSDGVSGANVQLSFTLNSLLLAFGCFILMVLLIILLGIGVGMR